MFCACRPVESVDFRESAISARSLRCGLVESLEFRESAISVLGSVRTSDYLPRRRPAAVATASMPPLPHSPAPIDNVVAVFGLILGIAVARTLPQLVSFYSWFSRSGLKIAEHRGYGQTACKMFGFIPAPKLSVVTMAFSGASFLALVLAPIGLPASMRAPALGLALVAYHLYFSQVYCEAHVGAHVTALIPPALILLALCPALDGDLPPIAAAQTAAFTCWLMKIVLTSAYCGAGLCKISKSVASLRRGGSSWCTGSTLQAWEAQGVGAQKAREASADAAKGYGRYGTQAAATRCDAGCNPM